MTGLTRGGAAIVGVAESDLGQVADGMNVIDLMAALKQSLSKERTAAPVAAPRRAVAAAARVSPAKRSKGRSRKSS